MSQTYYFENCSFWNGMMPKIMGIVFLGIGLFMLSVGWPIQLVTYTSTGVLPSNWLFDLIAPIACFLAGGMLLNVFPDLGISEEGLHVQFFAARWLFVPWRDVIGLSIAPATAFSKTPVYVIRVRKLTFWHRLLGFFMGSRTSPGVAFSSDIRDYDRLVKELKSRIEKAQGEVQVE